MKFYIVAGSFQYEGSDLSSSKLFFVREEAEAYGKSLLASYDSYDLVEREVE
jgi:hypothetical protein